MFSRLVVCSCHAHLLPQRLPPRLRPGDVMFCPACQTPRCRECCSYEIECKFCANCLHDYTESSTHHCTRTCFDCPECGSGLSLGVSDAEKNGTPGKVFSFTCLYCEYRFTTSTIVKPKPLHAIVRSETCADPYYGTFHKLHDVATDRAKLLDLEKKVTERTPTLVGLRRPELREARKSIYNAMDDLKKRVSLSIDPPLAKGRFPRPKRLTAKACYKCPSCQAPLVKPAPGPVSAKFLSRWNAIDYMPSLQITGVGSHPLTTSLTKNTPATYTLVVENPMPHEISIKVAILSELRAPFTQGEAQLSLPVTTATVHAADDTIKSVPTPMLTEHTKASRAERLMRRAAMPGPDDSIDDIPLDRGPGWVGLPFSILVNDAGPLELAVPFYVTVELKLPDSIRRLKLDKRGLKYGFWVIVPMPELSVK